MGLFLEAVIETILGLLVLAIILNAVLSWLVAFDVVNLRHPMVRQFAQLLDAVSRPALRPFQRFIPPLGGIDITPIIAIIIIEALQRYLVPWLFAPIVGLLGG
jgi:YggT family protein